MRRWARRASRLALIGAAVGTLLLLTAPRAAADYSVQQCVPGGQGYTEATWTPFGSAGFSIWGTNECGAGSMGSDSTRTMRFMAALDGPETAPVWPGVLRLLPRPAGLGERLAALRRQRWIRGRVLQRRFNRFPSSGWRRGASSLFTTAGTSSAHFLEIRLQCFASPNCHSNWSYVWTTSFAAEVRDESAPTISASGPLLSGGVVRGINGLQAAATDAGGGLRTMVVYVNGVDSRSIDFCSARLPRDVLHPSEALSELLRRTILRSTREKDPGWVDGPNDVAICSTDVGGNSAAVHPANRHRRQLLPGLRRDRRRRFSMLGPMSAESSATVQRSHPMSIRSSGERSRTARANPVPEQRSASTRRSISPTPHVSSSAR